MQTELNFIFATGHIDAIPASINNRERVKRLQARRFKIFNIDLEALMKTEHELIERVKQMQAECVELLAELAALKRTTLKTDDRVMVSTGSKDKWEKRYFKNFDGNKARCFHMGATSWSTDGSSTTWEYWRLPTEEELK